MEAQVVRGGKNLAFSSVCEVELHPMEQSWPLVLKRFPSLGWSSCNHGRGWGERDRYSMMGLAAAGGRGQEPC